MSQPNNSDQPSWEQFAASIDELLKHIQGLNPPKSVNDFLGLVKPARQITQKEWKQMSVILGVMACAGIAAGVTLKVLAKRERANDEKRAEDKALDRRLEQSMDASDAVAKF